MIEKKRPSFILNLKLGAFPLRLIIISILGVGATALILEHSPNLFALSMVILSVLLIIILTYIAYPLLKDVRVSWGLMISWYGSMLMPGLVYLLLPTIESYVSQTILMPLDQEITRIYLWVLGLFIVPLALGMEQLLSTQSEVSTLKQESEVSDLDFRIRPHFLFNSLNSVASLIAVDPIKAEDGLMDLADMFRVILTDKRKLVPFSAEYEMARKYMNLEKMRLGDRLRDEWQIGDIDDTILLPTLTLQPLIENAIYHGIETRLNGGRVTVRARQSKRNLYVSIINPKPEANKPVHKGNQIAQQNLINRFAFLYKGRAEINRVETENFYTVTIKVPRDMREIKR